MALVQTEGKDSYFDTRIKYRVGVSLVLDGQRWRVMRIEPLEARTYRGLTRYYLRSLED